MFVDPRFYAYHGPIRLGTVAELIGCELHSSVDQEVTGLSTAEDAADGDICFAETTVAFDSFIANGAGGVCFTDSETALGGGVCLTSAEIVLGSGVDTRYLTTLTPRLDFFKAASHLFSSREYDRIGAPAAVHKTAQIGQGCSLGADVAIGADTFIGPGTTIGTGVQIGAGCRIGANVSIGFSLIGNNVRVSSGARIGEAGFGLMMGASGAVDTPHFGRVLVQDNVSIGANTCVDRGLLQDTIVGVGTKIDNMCHVGHNVEIGQHVVMAGFTGISGSVKIGDGVQMGGRAGVVDHVEIGAGAKLGISSTTLSDVPMGEVWAGFPARPLKRWLREVSWLKRNAARKDDR